MSHGENIPEKRLPDDYGAIGPEEHIRGEDMRSNRDRRRHRLRSAATVFLALWALVATVFAVMPVAHLRMGSSSLDNYMLEGFHKGHHKPKHPVHDPAKPHAKRNLVFMVSDGMGPASLSMSRSWRELADGLPELTPLGIDRYFVGNSRSRSSNSLITDSAAGATAFACGLKTYNGAIGVDSNGRPCGTVLEAAKLAGYATGLVVTTRITDATPASFAAHASFRSEEDFIAAQLLGHDHPLGQYPADLIIGGGRCHFVPHSKHEPQGCRTSDKHNLLKRAKNEGWQLVEDRAGFDLLDGGANVSLPLLALLADRDIPFELDRQDEHYPSLAESVRTAMRALADATRDSEKGFFLLIEGSRIDHAGHINDPAAQVREVAAYSDAYEAVVEFINAGFADGETAVVSTSDHETGGLSVGRQLTSEYPDYLWVPEALNNATHSVEYLSHKLREYLSGVKSSSKDGYHAEKKIEEFVRHEILGPNGLNIAEQAESDVKALAKGQQIDNVLAEAISRAAQIGWATHGHSAVDVNVYAHANRQSAIDAVRGPNENIDFAGFMADYLEVNLPKWQ